MEIRLTKEGIFLHREIDGLYRHDVVILRWDGTTSSTADPKPDAPAEIKKALQEILKLVQEIEDKSFDEEKRRNESLGILYSSFSFLDKELESSVFTVDNGIATFSIGKNKAISHDFINKKIMIITSENTVIFKETDPEYINIVPILKDRHSEKTRGLYDH